MQLLSDALTMDGELDWTGLDGATTPVTPQGLERSTPWRTCCKVDRRKQGIIASSSLTCSNTAIDVNPSGCLVAESTRSIYKALNEIGQGIIGQGKCGTYDQGPVCRWSTPLGVHQSCLLLCSL